ncbi:cutinase [Eremomyces bilateralis CBS 781.70]|uniref:cutinase n=1 Tax=Eremomyces bilateralis CBS 781.70 TaxID=1392243 RepID=A0A6G1G885_9PEZI|nr:cutinase [Eremomyces bilateralis CBS 781.70]KAF1814278.1 cutinase [Eremomyces bilateralis CBS 781.70]
MENLRILQSEGRIPANDTLEPPTLSTRGAKEQFDVRQLSGSGCKPYTLIYARGTFEPGAFGISVGPQLTHGISLKMPGQWKGVGVEKGYDADLAGNACGGIPGGIALMRYLEAEVQKCPQTKIMVAGYSQGAMAVHNGLAYSRPEAKANVIGAVVYGDPMKGARIIGFPSEKLQTYCAADDPVCEGYAAITLTHFSYLVGSPSDVQRGVDWIVAAAKEAK